MSIRKKPGSKKWSVDFYYRGTRTRKSGFNTKRAAELYVAKRTVDKFGDRDGVESSQVKVAECVSLYSSEVLLAGKSISNMSYIRAINKRWGHVLVCNLKHDEVVRWVRELLKSKAVSTATKYLSYFKRIIGYSVEMGLVSSVPFSGVDFKREFRKANCRNMTHDSADKLKFMRCFDKSPEIVKSIISCLWHTGMRVGELLALQWGCVDINGGIIILSADQVKEGAVRTIAMEKEVISIFREMFPNRKGKYVFAVSQRNHYTYTSMYHNYRKAVDGTEWSGYNIHDIRHSYVKRKRQEGYDREVIKVQTGHSTDSMFNRYNDVDSEEVLNMAKFDSEKALIIAPHLREMARVIIAENVQMSTVYTGLREQLSLQS